MLSDVVFEVVKLQPAVFEEFDQLPIAEANRGGGRRAPFAFAETQIAREMPGEAAAAECLLRTG